MTKRASSSRGSNTEWSHLVDKQVEEEETSRTWESSASSLNFVAVTRASEESFDIQQVDIAEQERMLESFGHSLGHSFGESSNPQQSAKAQWNNRASNGDGEFNSSFSLDVPDHDDNDSKEPESIEVAPNEEWPLKSSQETWSAIVEGRIVVTQCCGCSNELACHDDAGLVLCSDCWVFSPVDQQLEGSACSSGELIPKERQSVGVGVKMDSLISYLDGFENSVSSIEE